MEPADAARHERWRLVLSFPAASATPDTRGNAIRGMPRGAMPPPIAHVPNPQVPYPQFPTTRTPDESSGFSQEWLDRTAAAVLESLRAIASAAVDRGNRVDEYRVQGNESSGESTSSYEMLPDYQVDEIIESLIVTGPSAGFGQQSNHGSVATPAAGATIASTGAVVTSGLYTVEWTVGIETAAATVADNFQLQGTQTSENGTAIGDYPQQSLTLYLPAGTGVVVKAIAADATATYSATIQVTPYEGSGGIPFTLQLGKRNWQLTLPPTGILVVSPINIKLGRNDRRVLIANLAANWSFELTGYADIPGGRRV